MAQQVHLLQLSVVLSSALSLGTHGASTPGNLHLDGLMIVHGNKAATARVVVTELHSTGLVLDNVAGHFTLVLNLDRDYLISFERDGLVTKLVLFDTHVPADQIGASYFFPFQVTLFEKGWNGVEAYQGPVGFVRFVPDKRDFVHRTDHRPAPGSAEEDRVKELIAARAIRVQPARSVAPDAVRGIIPFAKHGKRHGLFVGKAVDAEGRLRAEGRFLDSQLEEEHGEFIFYHGNGHVESRGRYENGQKVGVWERFDPFGGRLPDRLYGDLPLDYDGGSLAGKVVASPTVKEEPSLMSPNPMNGTPRTSVERSVSTMPKPSPTPARRAPGTKVQPPAETNVQDPKLPLERSEELLVERNRVITVVRIPESTGHITEYRRVADRYGAFLYFQDGRSIPYTM